MATGINESTRDKILGTLRNQTGTAEGTLLPPPQQGPFRVPFVTNLIVGQITTFTGGTQFNLIFHEPEGVAKTSIDHYNVFVSGLTGNLNVYNGPNTVSSSPAVVRVSTSAAQTVIFTVQTVMKSGLVSDLNNSPRVTATTVASSVVASDIPAGSLDISKLAPQPTGSLISWDATPLPALISPVATGSLLASTGTGSEPSYKTFATLNLVLGNTNLTTAGDVPYISSGGTLNQDDNHYWDSTNHRLSLGNNHTPTYTFDVTAGDIALATLGKKFRVKEGANASMGVATLAAGTVTVSTTAVTATSRILLTVQVAGGTQGFLAVGTVVAATSFVINSTSNTDTSQVLWLLFEPY
jgi:hypothetical protein